MKVVDIVSWDSRDQPDPEHIENAIGIGGRYCYMYNDGSDTYHLAFFRDKVVDEEAADQACEEYFMYINGDDPEDFPNSHHKATDR